MPTTQRESAFTVVTIEAGESESTAFQFYSYMGGTVLVPAAWTSANIGFLVSHLRNTGFYALKNENGNLVELESVVPSGWYNLPAELFGARYVKLWSKTTASGVDTDVNQAAERELYLMLKA
jgi:hypothetical protein